MSTYNKALLILLLFPVASPAQDEGDLDPITVTCGSMCDSPDIIGDPGSGGGSSGDPGGSGGGLGDSGGGGFTIPPGAIQLDDNPNNSASGATCQSADGVRLSPAIQDIGFSIITGTLSPQPGQVVTVMYNNGQRENLMFNAVSLVSLGHPYPAPIPSILGKPSQPSHQYPYIIL